MKKILFLVLAALCAVGAYAQKPAELNHAVVNVIAYDASGNVLRNAYGFLTGSEGEVVAPYQLLKGAARADVINWKGETAQAMRIIGASSEYDLVRFTTDLPTKKLIVLLPASDHAGKGQQVQVAHYSNEKKSLPATAEVTAADLYNGNYYYELNVPNEERYFGCPVLDAEGHVLAVVQRNVQKDATTACAIDVKFATELTTNALSAFSADLKDIHIAKQIPLDNEDDAFSYVYMLLRSGLDGDLAVTAADDFMGAFPDNVKVYAERATFYAGRGDYALAEADLEKAIAKGGEGLSDLYYTQSVLMYNKVLAGGEDQWPQWTLDTALATAQSAYDAQPLPLYLLQQGQVLFTQQKYAEAYDKFQAVNASDLASSQTFYFAANALERIGGDDEAVIALLDSAVNRLPTPYAAEAAPYLLARAQHLDNAAQHRRAVRDYNEYEKIIGPRNLNAYFYYLRMQAELGSRMYQQALDDADAAIVRAAEPAEKADYLFERACLQLKVNLLDECIASCTELIELAPDYAEAYKVLGVAYGEKKDKKRAQQLLQKAKELGSEGVDEILPKYM